MLKRLCALLLSLAMLASLSAAFAEGTVSVEGRMCVSAEFAFAITNGNAGR